MSIFPANIPQFVLFVLLVFSGNTVASGSIDSYEKKTDKPLQIILEDIEFAITERNLKIVNRLHIGQGIRDRGYEDFPDYETILYCNLDFARKMLVHEPGLINACPGRISVRQDDNSYIISAVLWPVNNRESEVNQLLYDMNVLVMEIVDYAARKWLDSHEK